MEDRFRGVRRVLLTILGLNLAVAAAKALVRVWTGSLSVEADAFHSALDGASNIVGLVAITMAAAAPDLDHPYGHRKFEVLGAMGIGVLLAAAAGNILRQAWSRFHGEFDVRADAAAYGVMGATMVVNVGVAWYEARRGRQLNSEVLLADSAHTKADVLATVGVLVSLLLASRGLLWVDLLVALGIAVLIAWAGVRVALSGAAVLADQAVLDPGDVIRVARNVEGVMECHEVRTRGTRDAIFADLRIHVAPEHSLTRAHEIAHRVEARLKENFQGLRDVVVHVEPHDHEPC